MQMQEESRIRALLRSGDSAGLGLLVPNRGLALRLSLQQGDLTSLTSIRNAHVLESLAHEALVCEQRGTLTCFLVQAVALLRSWHITTGLDPRQHQAQAREHGLQTWRESRV